MRGGWKSSVLMAGWATITGACTCPVPVSRMKWEGTEMASAMNMEEGRGTYAAPGSWAGYRYNTQALCHVPPAHGMSASLVFHSLDALSLRNLWLTTSS